MNRKTITFFFLHTVKYILEISITMLSITRQSSQDIMKDPWETQHGATLCGGGGTGGCC